MRKIKAGLENANLVVGVEDYQRLKDQGINVEAQIQPNPQQWKVLISRCYEMLLAGGRYGGKSFVGRMWMAGGNPDKPNYDEKGNRNLINESYLHHPEFLGVVIRKNAKDLMEWIMRAKGIFEPLGARFISNPDRFLVDHSGAQIFLGHFEDQRAWEAFQGLNIIRMLIEEAGQLPDLEKFELLRASVRSPWPEMRAQILLTANPIGPGLPWLNDRYIEPKWVRKGNEDKIINPFTKEPYQQGDLLINPNTMEPYKPEEVIKEKVIHPFTKEELELERVWIPSLVTDNPHAMKDTNYILSLATISDDKTRKAFLYGDWKAFQGTYFNFIPSIHVKKSEEFPVEPWWPCSCSLDWGFEHDSAAYKMRRNPLTGQKFIYDEFVINRTEPVQLGKELGYWLLPELKQLGAINLYLSHDAYQHKTGIITIADMLKTGLGYVIGRNNVHIPDLLVRELKERYEQNSQLWTPDLEMQVQKQQKAGITLRAAPRATSGSWMFVQSQLRHTPLDSSIGSINWQLAQRINEESGIEKFMQYIKLFNKQSEVLPQVLISSECRILIQAIPRAVHSESDPQTVSDKHFKGKDSLDSFCYLLTGSRDESLAEEPYDIKLKRTIHEYKLKYPNHTTNDLIWVNRHLEEQKSKSTPQPFKLKISRRGIEN